MRIEEFISEFNSYYPFERYIVKNPKPINHLFDDVVVTELFVPNTEIKPIIANGRFVGHTQINNDEIYIKLKGNAGEMRFALYDLADAVIYDIVGDIIHDFGDYEWEGLYVEHEDEETGENNDSLKTALLEQKRLIEEKYGECVIKKTINAELL